MTETNQESTYRKMYGFSVPKAALTERHYLFPNGHDKEHLATSEPFNIPFEMLALLKAEKRIKINLDRGVVKTYDNGSVPQTRHIEGFFDSVKGSGMMIGELTGSETNNAPKDGYLKKNEKYVTKMDSLELLKE